MTTLTLKKSLAILLTTLLAGTALIFASMPALAQVTTSNDNDDNGMDIGELIILSNLFAGGGLTGGVGGIGGFGLTGNTDLSTLIVLDALFDDDNDGDNNGLDLNLDFNGGNNDLGDLIILDSLFSGGGGLNILGGTQTTVYTVQRGDTLSAIAARFLGDSRRFNEIAALNGIVNPNLIIPGQVLRIPVGTTVNGSISNRTNLTNLILLDALFGDDND